MKKGFKIFFISLLIGVIGGCVAMFFMVRNVSANDTDSHLIAWIKEILMIEEGDELTIDSAYVNSEYHMIVVFSDGSELDAGYVGTEKMYAVAFNLNYDDAPKMPVQLIEPEGKASQPLLGKRNDYVFIGWFKDSSCTEEFDFETAITDNTMVYAGWREETYEDKVANTTQELNNIKELNGGELPTIMLDQTTYAPAFILGSYSDETVTDFGSALESLKDVEYLMGFEDVENEYVEVSSFTFKGTTQYRLQQVFNGYEVYGQQLIVTTDETGKITSLSGDYATIGILFDPDINVSKTDAIAAIAEYGEFDAEKAKLVVYTLEGYNEMAYVFENDAYTVVISADDGAILSAGSKTMTLLPTGGTATGTIGRDNSDSEGNTFNTAYFDYADETKTDMYIFYDSVRNIVYHDLGMQDSENIDLSNVNCLSDSDNVWDSATVSKTVSLYNNLSDVYDFYLEVLGLLSYDGNGGEILAYINDGYYDGKNAYSAYLGEIDLDENDGIPGHNYTALSFGGEANFQDFLDVVAHEFTHSVQNSTVFVGNYAQLEAGALKEAYSDVMGELVELYVTGSTDWIHGDSRNIKNPQNAFQAVIGVLERSLAYPEKKDGSGYWYRDPNATGKNLDNQNSFFGHHNSTVISHAIYKIYDSGINDVAELTELLYRAWNYLSFDATFYDYRMAMLAAATDMKLGTEKIGYIVDAFDDANVKIESYDDAWQIMAMVQVYCEITDGEGNPVPNAIIRVERTDANHTLIAEVQCDEEGKHRVDLNFAGSHRFIVSAIGYEEFSEIRNFGMFNTHYEWPITLTRESNQEAPVICKIGGKVKDAISGDFVEGVTLYFRKGYNVTNGGVVEAATTTTDETGYFETDKLEYGFYTVEIVKEGYIRSYEIVQAAASNWENSIREDALKQEFAISPYIQVDDTVRIVLTWGSTPNDLDSHLTGTTLSGSSYHVYFSNEIVHSDGEKVAELDVDDTTSYGPETITVNIKAQGGIFSYYIHDYTNKGSSSSEMMSKSGAKIQVYSGNRLIAVYEISEGSKGKIWRVFDYDPRTGRITYVNEYEG